MTDDVSSSYPIRCPAELFDLSDRVAIVTGASSGLGERFVRVLHGAGAHVVAVARRQERLDRLAHTHKRVVAMRADVTDETAVSRLIQSVIDRFGRIDVLVNNAGGGSPGPALDEELDDFRRSLELNVTSVFNLARLAAAPMVQARRGVIINVASIYGLGSSWPIPNTGYTAAKAAVVNLTRELACQWAAHGVRVNAIAPGYFPSESTQEMVSDQASTEFVARRTPMRRFGCPHELDGAIVFLASDASTFLTGQTIAVDGGWTAY
ncbi:SDR family NAD(P)-dependent oxidoreductase [Mycobacterium sp. E796]|uniref:SDR family NAD(P)-dependent oxidoreductase n=1 Tax=Mycobacterium sp. E796 TaxID=1834151 RepID=UPI0007FD2E01|nr:glucose 1-dehydrogenase [Mycobacterium sp. E796]OBI51991.1 hypothetical protein A5706_01990 [Mycobacterium sp. E796]